MKNHRKRGFHVFMHIAFLHTSTRNFLYHSVWKLLLKVSIKRKNSNPTFFDHFQTLWKGLWSTLFYARLPCLILVCSTIFFQPITIYYLCTIWQNPLWGPLGKNPKEQINNKWAKKCALSWLDDKSKKEALGHTFSFNFFYFCTQNIRVWDSIHFGVRCQATDLRWGLKKVQ